MKRKIMLFVALAVAVCAVFSLSACKDNSNEGENEHSHTNNCTVTYVYNNGESSKTVTVTEGENITRETPQKDGYIFVGWCTDANLSNFYDFNNKITSNITLFAKWTIDYESLVADITRDAVSFNVKVKTNQYNNSIFVGESQLGSGVIYNYKNGYYYILTNNHVVKGVDENLLTQHLVYDMYGNEYNATVVASDANYDLAVLKVLKKENVSLKIAKINQNIPSENETMITVTAPKGQLNAVEFGKIVGYKSLTIDSAQSELSNVTFDVLWLSNYSNHGSSGGAVINVDLELVGIIYGVGTNNDGSFKYTFAIPGAKVFEFIGKITQ